MYKIQEYKKKEGKKNLKGYIDLYIPEKRWLIRGFSLFVKDERYWVNPPSRAYKNEMGEIKYSDIVRMSKEDHEIFSREVVEALKQFDPEAPKPFEFKKWEPKAEQDESELPF
jgi:hypothetical protein